MIIENYRRFFEICKSSDINSLKQQVLGLNKENALRALEFFSANGHLEAVKLLLTRIETLTGNNYILKVDESRNCIHHCPDDKMYENGNELLALKYAAKNGHLEIVEILLKHGAIPGKDFTYADLLDDPKVKESRDFLAKFGDAKFAHKAINEDKVQVVENYYNKFLLSKHLIHSENSMREFMSHINKLKKECKITNDKKLFNAFLMGTHKRVGADSAVQLLNKDILWTVLKHLNEDVLHKDICKILGNQATQDLNSLFFATESSFFD